MTDTFDFYGGWASNFYHSPFIAKDQWGRLHRYLTCEHYFAAWKADNVHDHDLVLKHRTPSGAKQEGRKLRLRGDWEEIKFEVMLEGLRQKFSLGNLREELLSTGDKEIREDSPTDFVWGYRNGGLNLLGKALMQVRDEIRTAERIDEGIFN